MIALTLSRNTWLKVTLIMSHSNSFVIATVARITFAGTGSALHVKRAKCQQ